MKDQLPLMSPLVEGQPDKTPSDGGSVGVKEEGQGPVKGRAAGGTSCSFQGHSYQDPG